MNGLNKGFQLIADFIRFLIRAVETNNTDALTAAISVGKIWLGEATGTAGSVKGISVKSGLTFALLFGDPFATSRSAFRALSAKYPTL